MPIDLKTLLMVNLITNLIAFVATGILWYQYHSRYRGISHWLANVILQSFSIILFLLRGRLPDFFSVVVANLAIQAGAWSILIGLRRFFGKPASQWHNVVLLGAFFLAFTYWSIVDPNLNIRNILLAACMAILTAQIAWFMLLRVSNAYGGGVRLTGFTALAFTVINCVRMTSHVVSPDMNNDFFRMSGLIDTISLIAYLALSILLFLALFLLLNQQLLSDIHAQEEKFVKAFHAAPYAVLITRISDGMILEVNRSFESASGYSRDELLNKTSGALDLWLSEEIKDRFIGQLLKTGHVRDLETEFLKKDGSHLIGVISAETIRIGTDNCVIASIGDITEQARLREQLKEMALHDALTGLPNRRLFYDRFDVALANAIRNGRKMAVIALDLDHFKVINDEFGHETGDRVLSEASSRLTGMIRKVDTVARFGGDEFVILLFEVRGAPDAEEVASKVMASFAEPYIVSGRAHTLKASLGIAIYPDDGTDLATLLRRADEALYFVKAHGRNGFRLASSI